MESIFEVLAALMIWRLILSAGVSIVLALMLSHAFVGFTAGYCITLVLFGVAFGIVWQSRAEIGVGLLEPVPETPISNPVAFLGFLLIGFFWGGLASWLLSSQIFGALALVCSVGAVGLWYRFLLRRPVSASYLIFSSVSLLLGFGLLLLLTVLNA